MDAICERIIEVNKIYPLLSVDFFDRNGNLSAKRPNDIKKVELTFANGEVFKITYKQFKSFGDYGFKLDTGERLNQ